MESPHPLSLAPAKRLRTSSDPRTQGESSSSSAAASPQHNGSDVVVVGGGTPSSAPSGRMTTVVVGPALQPPDTPPEGVTVARASPAAVPSLGPHPPVGSREVDPLGGSGEDRAGSVLPTADLVQSEAAPSAVEPSALDAPKPMEGLEGEGASSSLVAAAVDRPVKFVTCLDVIVDELIFAAGSPVPSSGLAGEEAGARASDLPPPSSTNVTVAGSPPRSRGSPQLPLTAGDSASPTLAGSAAASPSSPPVVGSGDEDVDVQAVLPADEAATWANSLSSLAAFGRSLLAMVEAVNRDLLRAGQVRHAPHSCRVRGFP